MSADVDSRLTGDVSGSDRVSLVVPARPEYVALCRLTIAGLGSSAGLDHETVGDLKLAVAEACAHMIGSEQEGRDSLQVDFEVRPECWVIEVHSLSESRGSGQRSVGFEPGDLGLVVMQALVDEVILEELGDSSAVLRLVKRF